MTDYDELIAQIEEKILLLANKRNAERAYLKTLLGRAADALEKRNVERAYLKTLLGRAAEALETHDAALDCGFIAELRDAAQ